MLPLPPAKSESKHRNYEVESSQTDFNMRFFLSLTKLSSPALNVRAGVKNNNSFRLIGIKVPKAVKELFVFSLFQLKIGNTNNITPSHMPKFVLCITEEEKFQY